jgi:hypothetical protein
MMPAARKANKAEVSRLAAIEDVECTSTSAALTTEGRKGIKCWIPGH